MRFNVFLGLRLLFAAALCYAFVASKEAEQRASLSVTIRDAGTGRATPARVLLKDAQSNTPRVSGALPVSDFAFGIPPEAIGVMYGRRDVAEGYLSQPDGSFYADGKFTASLPAGTYTISVSKGYEFIPQSQTFKLAGGEKVSRSYELKRWIDMPKRGWFSADDHIHLRRSPRDNAAILRWTAAEDIHVGNLLEMGDFWATYYAQYGWGEKGRYQEGDYILTSGQEEPRTGEIGHTISLGANGFVRFANDYYSYGRVFDRVHELGGISGFAHQAMTFAGYRGMTLNVLRGKIDFLEVMQFCAKEGPLALDHYQHFLDLGYKLTALAGSDFPWCGRGPAYGVTEGGPQIGNARFYTYTGRDFSLDRWLAAVKAGHTFVSTGPMVELAVNGKMPGDTLDIRRGERLTITAKAYGQKLWVPLRELEVLAQGEVLKKAASDGPGQGAEALSLEAQLQPEHGTWIVAKVTAGPTQVAYTTPVYVTIGGGGFHNPKTAGLYLEKSEQYLREIEDELAHPGTGLDRQAARHRQALERQVAETREVLRKLTSDLGAR